MLLFNISVLLAVLSTLLKETTATCYFVRELQGTFITQSTVTHVNEVLYSKVNITEDSIPIWGQCYKRIDNNVILKIDSEETSCYRCFRLKLVSRNVLRVHTADKDYISKCYTNEAKAIASCPTTDILKDRNLHKEIILYKIYEFNGDEINREYCPINGQYHFMYNIDDGINEPIECTGKESEMDNCPSGSAINLRFRNCSFENREVKFECLGHWQGLEQQKYMALMNTRVNDKLGPQYRCAIYTENPNNGVITVTFSSDSTCSSIATYSHTNHAGTFQEHNEILTLYPSEERVWYHQQNQYCHLPDWMHGHWEYVTINENEIIYKDHSSFKTYTMKCIKSEIHKINENPLNSLEHLHESKFLAFSRTQCGEEQYHCVWIIKRSANILEFQIGSKTIQHLDDGNTDFDYICDEKFFDKTRWLTQGRLDHSVTVSPCPVDGEFEGLIPDSNELCAKLWSECESPDIMYYQVSVCGYDEVFEEREYQCLGQWTENGVVYTYTERRDIGTYECFVGALNSNQEIFIKEAGEHCQRDVDPYRYGMQLKQTKYCNNNKHKLTKGPNNNNRNILKMDGRNYSNNIDTFPSIRTFNDTMHILPVSIDDKTTESIASVQYIFNNTVSNNIKSNTESANTEFDKIYQHGNNSDSNKINDNIQIVNINHATVLNNSDANDNIDGDRYYTSTTKSTRFGVNRKKPIQTKKLSDPENETAYSGAVKSQHCSISNLNYFTILSILCLSSIYFRSSA